MKKKSYIAILSIFVFTVPFFLASGAGNLFAEEAPSHPLALSPEKTLETFLTAFINKDIDTVMAYLPGSGNEKYKKWRDRMSSFYSSSCMAETRHVKGIVEIKLLGIKEEKAGKVASLNAKIETTPKFVGTVDCDGQGKCTVSFDWTFIQGKNGAWFYWGGGF